MVSRWKPSGPALMASAALAASLLGPILAWARTPSGMVFGGFVEEARDGLSYVAKTVEGLSGHWLYHDPYTSEAHPGSLIYLPYLLLGQLDRLLHLPVALLIHLAGLGLGAWLLWSLWRLAEECLPDRGAAWAGFLLAILGGGAGALTGSGGSVLGYHLVSLDVGVSGSVGMQTLEVAPHIILACLGSVELARLWVRTAAAPRPRDLAAGAAWVLAISAAYPQMAALWPVIGAAAWILRRSRGALLTTAAWALAAAPYILYGLWLRGHNPIFAAWPPSQDVDVGDPLSYLLWGHLLMLPPAALAGWRALVPAGGGDRGQAEKGSPLAILALWVLVSALLMYLPGLPSVLHRLYYGSFAAFGVLAAGGLWSLRARLASARAQQRLAVYGVLLMSLAGLRAVIEPAAIVLGHRDDLAIYLPAPPAAVLGRLAELRPGGGALVMSTYLSGLWVPGLSRQTVYAGFPFETLDLARKDRDTRVFYGLSQPEVLQDRASAMGLDYVLWGPYEQALGGQDPGRLAGWQVVAQAGSTVLYRVRGATAVSPRRSGLGDAPGPPRAASGAERTL